MPRAKPARRGKPPPRIFVGPDDPLPPVFLGFLETLSTDEPQQVIGDEQQPSQSRPSKKRKVTAQVPDGNEHAVCIGRQELSLERLCDPRSDKPSQVTHRGVHQHVSIQFEDGNMKIAGRGKPGSGNVWIIVALHASQRSLKFEQLAELTSSSPSKLDPGALWQTLDILVDRRGDSITVNFTLQLFWNETPSSLFPFRSSVQRAQSQKVIDTLFPPSSKVSQAARSPMDFYNAAYVPPRDDENAASIDLPGLEATLYPYQKRALSWMLRREGMQWDQNTRTLVDLPAEERRWASTFRTIKDADGDEIFLSDVYHVLTRDTSPYRDAEALIKGGILAEEMGLGKTLEILGLVLLNGRRDLTAGAKDSGGLLKSGATLIVAPESLRSQWLSEIAMHAPGLRVKHYEGCRKLSREEAKRLTEELTGYDVVVTTYSVFSAEIHFAQEPPTRSMRHEAVYERIKSPLVSISWWRLCLDEAQMIESGFTKAAEVARSIPRVNAWGITGTPVKDNVGDLKGLLMFLGYSPYCYASHVWEALIRKHKANFEELFNTISLRHTKTLVRNELTIPPQKRYVVSMPFTAVEEQHYQTLFKEMAEECGMSVTGEPMDEEWNPEVYEESMRRWLVRLRQTALHPEVGVHNRRALGYSRNRPMRTVDEVLDAMLEQSEGSIRTEEREWLAGKLVRGQIYENGPRVKEALALWEEVLGETTRLVLDARTSLKELVAQYAVNGGQGQSSGSDSAGQRESSEESDSEDNISDPEDRLKLGEARRRLRSALDMHHKAIFFIANAHFQIKENEEMTEPASDDFTRLEKLEKDGYDEAKAVRREILRESHRKATKMMDKILRKATNQTFATIPELFFKDVKGIESARVISSLEVLYGELNQQANALDELREHTVQLVMKPLVDEDDDVETTGDELGESAKVQDEIAVHVQILRAVILDRQDALTGQTNELIKHELEVALRFAKDGEGAAPEKFQALLNLRDELKPKMSGTSLRGTISELRGIHSRLHRADGEERTPREVVEARIVSDHLRSVQEALTAQGKITRDLENELDMFTAAMNLRLEYYRQLQYVSDSVLPYEGPISAQTEARLKKQEDLHRNKMLSAQAKHRYLLNLKETGSKSNEPKMCIICQAPFTTGVLTVCGHQFCKDCIMMWFKAHHNCPVCKKKLTAANLHDITFKAQEFQIQSEGAQKDQPQGSPSQRNESTKKAVIYSEFNADKMEEIKNIELVGPSFTTKVDTLVRHIIWLRRSDPGAKSIIFSQYRDFLSVLRNAFSLFRIGFSSIDDAGGITKFKSDASVEVFLLHARAHSSGLNLVNASHVFLCEPLLNTALELQAIARVDRIGQLHETTVWLYVVSGTVEESIYDLSARRRMEHIGSASTSRQKMKERPAASSSTSRAATPTDASIVAANTLELETAALSKLMSRDKTAGEMVQQGDLWECLFGHVAAAAKVAQQAPDRDARFRDRAVVGFLAGEAAEERRIAEASGSKS